MPLLVTVPMAVAFYFLFRWLFDVLAAVAAGFSGICRVRFGPFRNPPLADAARWDGG
jgi:hypothetical protein